MLSGFIYKFLLQFDKVAAIVCSDGKDKTISSHNLRELDSLHIYSKFCYIFIKTLACLLCIWWDRHIAANDILTLQMFVTVA